ncbi:MAG: NADH-quinone oxidoreductase subunit N [Chloroflexi bacterium]|nr:NADH-quinone oxidoreductase subunit N [Chloroflexota bacterium]
MISSILAQVKITQSDLDALGKVEWGALWPAWLAGGGVLIVLLADLVLPKSQRWLISWVAFVVLALATASTFWMDMPKGTVFQNMIAADEMSRFLAVIVLGVAALVVLASPDYLSRIGIEATGEYYALILAAATGMWLITVAAHFMVFFVALELFSLALYILCGFLPRSVRSHESGFKYFLLSSFASAFLLYGIALIFGATGSTGYSQVQQYLTTNHVTGNNGILVLLGLAMVTVGFAFKISAIPFHMWTPDVYEGAPTPVTALMAVGTKTAIVAAFLRVYTGVFGPIGDQWKPIIFTLAILTMIGGNLLAVSQQNIKRLLAYSAVAHAGYLMIGLVADNSLSRSGLLFYLLGYTVMTLGAFAVVMAVEGPQGENLQISDFAGLNKRHPWLAAIMTICLLSLAGIPPTVGFFGKAFIFGAAIQSGGWNIALAIVGIVTSVIAAFYYFRIIVQMYAAQPAGEPEAEPASARAAAGKPAPSLAFVLFVAVVATIGLGILANFALDWANTAASVIGAISTTRGS